MEEKLTHFHQVVSAAMNICDVSQIVLARHLETSQATVSRALRGVGHFEAGREAGFASALGGEEAKWQEVYQATIDGSPRTLGAFIDEIFGSRQSTHDLGSNVRLLLGEEIVEIFAAGEYSDEAGYSISNFDPIRVTSTTYRARLGLRFINGKYSEVDDVLSLAAHEGMLVSSYESFDLPDWLKINASPSNGLASKALTLSGVAGIEAGGSGFLSGCLENKSGSHARIGPDDDFVDVEFWLIERLYEKAERSNAQARTSFS